MEDTSYLEPQENKNPWATVLVVIGVVLLVALLVFMLLKILTSAPPPANADDSWARVQTAGVLKVGTAVDYPPFSYYNDQHMIDGFDPALIREIGRKLDVEVEVVDFAFEGLDAALQIGQIDVVIAALSVTPGREATLDFSNIYYVGEDGILARDGSETETVINPDQIAGKRIGVQKLSIYEDWVRTHLVLTGKISDDMLFVYTKPEHAVGDLKVDRLDLVMMDLQPATLALADGGVKLVGKGLNQQRYAIAVQPGAEELRARINQALLDLQNEGKVTQLVQLFLGLDSGDILPPPTPEPTPEACVDVMQFVKDLTLEDEDLTDFPQVDPGEKIEKGWRLRNSGTCVWDGSYFIKYVRGSSQDSQMQGQPTTLDDEVESGETYDMYVDLVAPQESGEHVGYWQMFNASSEAFGQTVWVAVKVRSTEPEVPTETPELTETPPVEPTTTEAPPELTETPSVEPTATEVPPTPTATEEPGSELLGPTWVLDAYQQYDEDDVLIEPLPDIEINIVFENEEFQYEISGSAGCNTYTGNYETDGVEIALNEITATKKECTEPEGITQQETRFLELLEQADEYRIVDDQLELLNVEMVDGNREEILLLVFNIKEESS